MQNKAILLALLTGCVFAPSSYAQEPPAKWGGHVELEAKKGNNRDLGEAHVFLPLAQTENSLLFTDIRGTMDNHGSREGNIGIGYRMIPENKFLGLNWIVGGYGFLDRRITPSGNGFTQGTFGAEVLSENWDVRANAYLPQGGEKEVSGSAADVQAMLSGTQLRVVGTAPARERALPGFDAEVGYKIPVLEDKIDAIRFYVGGFHFDAEDYDDVTGPRGRMEISWADLPVLGENSRFTLGGEIQHDEVRDTTAFVGARLRIPLQNFSNAKKSARLPLSALEQRMTETIVRDVDIVSNARRPVVDEAAAITVNGTATENIIILDANDNVHTEVTNAGAGAAIILDGSAGTINNAASSITLLDSQYIIGGGIAVQAAQSGYSAVYGTRPTLTANAGVDVFNVNGSDNVTVTGLDITGGRYGLYTNNGTTSNLDASDLYISGGTTGINLSNADTSAITNITIANTTSIGLTATTTSNSTFSNITIDDPAATGFSLSGNDNSISGLYVNDASTSILLSGTSTGNTFTDFTSLDSGNFGISVAATGANTFSDFTITNSNSFGFVLANANGSTVSNGTIDTTASNSGMLIANAQNISLNDIDISSVVSRGIHVSTTTNISINNVSVTNAGTDSFWFNGAAGKSGSGNTSTNPGGLDCRNTGGTGSVTINSVSCP